MRSGEERTIEVNGVELCTQAFGDTSDPTVLLIGTSMLAWDAEMCRRLAEGGRCVVRYDLRDTGRSTTVDPDDPAYTLRDLARTPLPCSTSSASSARTSWAPAQGGG